MCHMAGCGKRGIVLQFCGAEAAAWIIGNSGQIAATMVNKSFNSCFVPFLFASPQIFKMVFDIPYPSPLSMNQGSFRILHSSKNEMLGCYSIGQVMHFLAKFLLFQQSQHVFWQPLNLGWVCFFFQTLFIVHTCLLLVLLQLLP